MNESTKMRADWMKFLPCQSEESHRSCIATFTEKVNGATMVRLCSCPCHHIPLGPQVKR